MSVEELFERARAAASPEDRARCLDDVDAALVAAGPVERGRLLMCRARVHANQWRTDAVVRDALEAMQVFEDAGEGALVLDAASLAAGFASRSGELSLAAELATKCMLAVDFLTEDGLVADVANRMGIFCYSFLDYDRAVEQFEESLAAAERAGDTLKVCQHAPQHRRRPGRVGARPLLSRLQRPRGSWAW